MRCRHLPVKWTSFLLSSIVLMIWCFLGKCRLVVILQDKTYVYDINSLAILDTIDTVSNLKGEIGWHYILAQLNQKMSFFKWPCSFFFPSSQGFAHSPQVWMDVSWLYLPASPKDPCCCTMLWTCIYIVRLWHKKVLLYFILFLFTTKLF